MKQAQILEIKNALVELGKERLPIAYEVARNIRICNKILDEVTSISKELFEKFADRDENGNVIQVPDEVTPGKMVMQIKTPEGIKAWHEATSKLISEEHIVEFIKIPHIQIQNEKIDASIILPLLDVIIE